MNLGINTDNHKKEKVTTEKVETNQNNPKPNGGSEVQASRTFTYEPHNAVDGSNGTRWVASREDKTPHLTLDLGKVLNIKQYEMAFTHPALGHSWILEKSLDEKNWQVCSMQDEPIARSPHIATKIGEARYLRIKIIKGNPGLWEIKVY